MAYRSIWQAMQLDGWVLQVSGVVGGYPNECPENFCYKDWLLQPSGGMVPVCKRD